MTLKKEDRKTLLNQFWLEADSGNRNFRERMTTAIKFVNGGDGQWEQADLEKLDRESRPHFTFNFLKPIVRNISGYQRENRQEGKVRPRKGASKVTAQILTETIKYLDDNSNALPIKSFSFVDGVIGGKGWIILDIDYADDIINGDLKVRDGDPFAIYEDPNCLTYDLNEDGQYIWSLDWMIKSKIEESFSKLSKDQIQSAISTAGPEDTKTVITDVGNDTKKIEGSEDVTSEESRSPETFRYRVKTCWWKSWESRRFLVDTETLEVKPIKPGWWSKFKSKVEELLGSSPHIKLVTRVVPILNYTVMLGKSELDHIEDPFKGATKFPIIRFCPDWRKGHAKGEVEDLQDPSKEANKRYSQATHHLNQSANSGLICDNDAFGGPNCSSWEDVRLYGSKPGMVLKKKPGSSVEQREPVQISSGHLTLSRQAPETMKSISGVNADALGERTRKDESGIAIEKRIEQGQTTTVVIHDNWQYSEKIYYETLVDYVIHLDIISPEEMVAIVQEENIEIKGPDGSVVPPEVLMAELKKRKTGKYGVVVDLSPATATAKLEAFKAMVDTVKAGLPFPPTLLIKKHPGLNEGDKQEALAYIEQQQQQQIANAKAEAEAKRTKPIRQQ